jgi:hypothetical protein
VVKYELRIQDPTDPPRSALFDVIVELVGEGKVSGGRWFFGFLTGSGMDALLAVPSVASSLHSAAIHVVVGLDAVTDRAGLRRLAAIQAVNAQFSVAVIKNTTGALIHPKMLVFDYDDGRRVLVVGSNNMSANGLGGNVEGYTVVRFAAGETVDLSDWDDFLSRWAAMLSPIDDEAMAMAERNEKRMDRIKRAVKPGAGTAAPTVVVSDGVAHEAASGDEAEPQEPILVAVIPRASARWPQIHYSADIVHKYFNSDAGDTILLREVHGTHVEERQVVYSMANKNYKIELGAAGVAQATGGYPAEGRPVVVFRREGASGDRHRYVFLMPGDPGHAEMVDLATSEFSGPTNQVPRVIVPRNRAFKAWPGCPL